MGTNWAKKKGEQEGRTLQTEGSAEAGRERRPTWLGPRGKGRVGGLRWVSRGRWGEELQGHGKAGL